MDLCRPIVIKAIYRLVENHPADHMVHGKKGKRDGDNRDAADQEKQVQLEQRDALELQDFQEAGRTGLFRRIRVDPRSGGGIIFTEKQKHSPFTPVWAAPVPTGCPFFHRTRTAYKF